MKTKRTALGAGLTLVLLALGLVVWLGAVEFTSPRPSGRAPVPSADAPSPSTAPSPGLRGTGTSSRAPSSSSSSSSSLPRPPKAATAPDVEGDAPPRAPGMALDVRVVFPTGATPPARVWVFAAPEWDTPIDAAPQPTDAEGRVQLVDLPEGTLRILALAKGSGRGQAWVTLPRDATGPLVLELPPERVVTVEVVDAESGAGIAGAEVKVSETVRPPGISYVMTVDYAPAFPRSTTDAMGHLILEGLAPGGWIRLAANAEGYPQVPARRSEFGTARLETSATSVQIALPRGRTVRWPIDTTWAEPPPDGTPVVIRPATHDQAHTTETPTQGVIEGGELGVAGWPPGPIQGLGVLPDGMIGRLFARAGEKGGAPITFFPARRIVVVARYRDCAPAAGFYVNVHNEGNVQMAPSLKTDAEGRVVFEGLYGGKQSRVRVSLCESAVSFVGHPIGIVDLEKGDGHLEATVERMREAVLHFRAGGLPLVPNASRISLGGTTVPAETVPDKAGVVRFSWRPRPGREEADLHVGVRGYLRFHTLLPVPPVGEALEADVDLEAGGVFVVRVLAPEGSQIRIAPQRRDEDSGTWTGITLPSTMLGGFVRPDANGVVRFEPLPPGCYRALETLTGVVSEAVDVTPGGPTPEVTFDLRRAGWVEGRVALPGSHPKMEGVEVIAEGLLDGATGKPLRAWIRPDGTFQLRVPGDREVVLRAACPTLRPHPTEGTARVTFPTKGIVLRLVEGATASVAFDRPLARPRRWPDPVGVRVLLFRGEVGASTGQAVRGVRDAERRRITFGGFEPGTYTVWIDAAPYAPLVLQDCKLAAGETDLGKVAVSEGARIVVDLQVPEGQAAPRSQLSAVHEGAPTYRRSSRVFKGTHLVLSGLGPGSTRIVFSASPGAERRHEETVDLAEGEERHINLDVRK